MSLHLKPPDPYFRRNLRHKEYKIRGLVTVVIVLYPRIILVVKNDVGGCDLDDLVREVSPPVR